MTKQLAKHLREVYFGGNWTSSNLKNNLADVSWEESVTRVYSFNTIATLTYHIGYYLGAAIRVLNGQTLDAKDELSFNHPPINSKEDWQTLQDKIWLEVEILASLIEKLPESKLWEDFSDKKHGNYYRNISGIIEHSHYHLGQIALIKKIIRKSINS